MDHVGSRLHRYRGAAYKSLQGPLQSPYKDHQGPGPLTGAYALLITRLLPCTRVLAGPCHPPTPSPLNLDSPSQSGSRRHDLYALPTRLTA